MKVDFNAKIEEQEIYKSAIGKYSTHENTNRNGFKLVEFVNERRTRIVGPLSQQKNINKITLR